MLVPISHILAIKRIVSSAYHKFLRRDREEKSWFENDIKTCMHVRQLSELQLELMELKSSSAQANQTPGSLQPLPVLETCSSHVTAHASVSESGAETHQDQVAGES